MNESYLLIKEWEKYGVLAGVTTRKGGFSKNEYKFFNFGRETDEDQNLVENNYKKWCDDFNFTELYNNKRILYTNQVHGDEVLIIDEDFLTNKLNDDNIFEVDGFITNLKGKKQVILTVITADCQSIFLFDKNKMVISVVHSGWKGTYKKIVLKSLTIMKEKYISNPENILIYLGPCIRPSNYEVSNDFKNYFSKKNSLITNGGKLYFDISRENYNTCRMFGIPDSNISDINLCTFDNQDLFYSHRRDKGITGRMLSFITINSY